MGVKRNRISYLIAAVAVAILGLSSRRYSRLLPESLASYAGDTLWALMVFLGIGMLFPRWSTMRVSVTALLFAFSIELSQLFHSAWLNQIRHTKVGGLILGYGFLWTDLLCYGVGIGTGCILEKLLKGEKMRWDKTGSGGLGTRLTPPPGLGMGFSYLPEIEEHARDNYNKDVVNARKQAKDLAKKAAKVDLNVLRGRGPEFVLEFTAVVVLVFAVTILGLLLVLKSEPIATLLAAIAGYVLGRAATRRRGSDGEEEARAAVRTAEMTDSIRAVAGITKPPGQPESKPEEKPEGQPSRAPEQS